MTDRPTGEHVSTLTEHISTLTELYSAVSKHVKLHHDLILYRLGYSRIKINSTTATAHSYSWSLPVTSTSDAKIMLQGQNFNTCS
jgi:hypothetical protein